MIKDFYDGYDVDGVFLIKTVNQGVNKNNSKYLNIVLQDKTGTIEAKLWSINPEDLEIYQEGSAVKIKGLCNTYKDHIQLKILSGEKANLSTDELNELVKVSPISFDTLKNDLKEIINLVENNICKIIIKDFFNNYYEKYLIYPAATSNHHDFMYGLLHHSVSMAKIAIFFSKHYNDIDKDLLITGCLLHDIGKIFELSGPLTTKYTTEGNLLGHISIGMNMISEIARKNNIENEEKVLLLKHMILAHHGKKEYGSPITPSTKEALLLSHIDDIDSKIMVIEKAFENTKKGEFTERIFALENSAFYKPIGD